MCIRDSTYTALGAVFAAAGAQVQAVMQMPAVTIGVALLFLSLIHISEPTRPY